MFVLNIVVLKWQIWGNRLLLPWALLTCPVLVAMTGAWRLPWLRTLAGTLLLLQAIFVLSFSLNRPLVPLPLSWRYTGAIPLFSGSRTARFFAGYNSETIPVCQQLVALIREKHWRRIGLAVDENYPEYPLWRAMHEAGLDQVEFYHVNAAFPPGYHTPTWPPLVDGYVNVPSSPLRRGH
jgi:hypothetical protein